MTGFACAGGHPAGRSFPANSQPTCTCLASRNLGKVGVFMGRIVLLLSLPPTTPGHCHLHCAGLFGALLGCTTGTRCFLPSLGQRGTALRVPPRHNPTGCAEHHRTMFHEILPTPGTKRARQRCYFGRRLLDQTKHSGETAEPNKCLPTSWAICATPQDHGMHHHG